MSNPTIRTKTSGALTSQERSDINKTVNQANTNQTGVAANVSQIATNVSGIATNVTDIGTNVSGIATNVTAIGLNTDARTTQAARETATVEEITALVTLTVAEIVGTAAGDVGHVDGAILIAAPTSDYVLEFVSAMLIYDYDTATYGGGGDDIVVQVGGGGTQVTVSGAITGANLLEAAGDKILQLGAIATELLPGVGSAISIAGTALTQPGLPEVCTLQMTVAEDTGGVCDVILDGVTYNVTLTADTVDVNAGEIQAVIDLLPGYSASVVTDTVTITAAATGNQTDATFAQGTCNSTAGTVIVTQQGVASAAGSLRVHITYRIHTTGL